MVFIHVVAIIKEKEAGMLGIFKQCSCCNFIWPDQDSFLNDKNITIIGYKANFKILDAGLFFFNHEVCKSTITLQTLAFKNLYSGPIYQKRATGTKECPAYCLRKDVLLECLAECECAYVRDIIQIIKNWPKK